VARIADIEIPKLTYMLAMFGETVMMKDCEKIKDFTIEAIKLPPIAGTGKLDIVS
jgi:hypothetical protein